MIARSLSRELALLVLGQISESNITFAEDSSLDILIQKSIETLKQHWLEVLDTCAQELECAQQKFEQLDEIVESKNTSVDQVKDSLHNCLLGAENLLNGLSATIETPQILMLSDHQQIRSAAIQRINLVLQNRNDIDEKIDKVMEGWRLKRLPRIDRDILRLAFVDLILLKTPKSVSCNEAVELANRYSDDQGRRMINGVLRKLQDSYLLRGAK